MEFYTSSGQKRPVRLSEATRKFAKDSLDHKYGLDTLRVHSVSLEGVKDYDKMSALEKYNAGVIEIASKAPIRICDGELLSGAATLGAAIDHAFPAAADGEMRDYSTGVSHLTVDFSEVLAIGMDGIREKAEKYLALQKDPEKQAFLRSCIHCIDCMRIWRDRYIDELTRRGGFEKNAENLSRVPFRPAQSFYEAVQSIWFCFAFMRLTGNWPGIGRLDVLLGKYLKDDIENGSLTLGEAREILAHFFIKGCEWITGKETYGGDAQHYQNIVLSGIDEDGRDVTNEVTYLVLDIVEETGIGDFPITVRINRNTGDDLLRRAAEVIRLGGGVVALYNEDVVLRALTGMGYTEREARRFANDGCWEVQIPGATKFGYVPFDALKILQHVTLGDYTKTDFGSFDELFAKYESDLREQIKEIFEANVLGSLDEDHNFKREFPCTVVSLFEHSCIEKGLSYTEGGTDYAVVSPHIGGAPDAANSLFAIKKVVFDDGLVTFARFMEILGNNWEGEEELRLRILNGYGYFGNGSDEVDEICAKLLDDFSEMCEEFDGATPVRFVAGVSTFGRQLIWAPGRLAAPFGRKAGEVLSGNLSPTPGTDKEGAAAIIRSYCRADLTKQRTGAALDIGLIGNELTGDNASAAIVGLIKGFAELGGFFMQIDTVDRNTLIEAQKDPLSYQNLSVRVSGWNARFVTMSKEWQDMIIDRTK